MPIGSRVDSGTKLCPSWWRQAGEGGQFVNLSPAFRQIGGGQRAFLTSVSSQMPSAHNNPYAKAAYFEMACPELLLSYFGATYSPAYLNWPNDT